MISDQNLFLNDFENQNHEIISKHCCIGIFEIQVALLSQRGRAMLRE